LSVLVDHARLKLAAAAVLLSPYLPLLFMGEEYGEDAPFNFFSDHEDEKLRKELREGRKKEFEAFEWGEDPPDPQEERVFMDSKLRWRKRDEGEYRALLEWHRALIHLRKTHPLLKDLSRRRIRADMVGDGGLAVHRHSEDGRRQLLCLFNFSSHEIAYNVPYHGAWKGETVRLPAWGAAVYDMGDTSTTTLRSDTFTVLPGE
jgi:maltooligosyltrehalose trehalohydrolase